MSVILRCPSCGTARETEGECEACHGPSVRYFCTSHDPGLWLTGPTCPQCDARAARARPRERPVVRRELARPSLRPAALPLPAHAPTLARPTHAELDWEPTSPKQLGGCVLRLALAAFVLLAVVVFALYLVASHLPAMDGPEPVDGLPRAQSIHPKPKFSANAQHISRT